MKTYNSAGGVRSGFVVVSLLSSMLLVSGCGGGGGGSSAPITNSTPAPQISSNVQPITVDAGPANNVNMLFTTLRICAPGSSTACRTVDHILVDTGSSGLRIFASALSPALTLPQQNTQHGVPLVECTQFVDGYVWGPIKTADLKIAGEQANSLAIQVMGDTQFPNVPTACANTGPSIDTPQSFGANGVLGIGIFVQDCGPACAQSARTGIYYECTVSGCQTIATPLAQQVLNPVASFAADNNGAVIKLPAISSAGAATVSGSLVFGIGTQTNNVLGNANVLTVDPNTGNLTTVINSKTYSESFFDSGSNALYFTDDNTPLCSNGFYCPPSPQTVSATNMGGNGRSSTVTFSVASSDALSNANPTFTAFNSLAGPNANLNSVDWGLPFFYGRNVFTAIEGKNTAGGGVGPYVAY